MAFNGPHGIRPRQDAVRERRRPRPPLLRPAGRQQHPHPRAELADHVGKILRLKDDGTAPADNPFVGRAGAQARDLHVRPPQQLRACASTPRPASSGRWRSARMGGDEINILKPGANYGWPLVSQGRNYSGTLVSDQPWHRDGMEQPRDLLGAADQPGRHGVLHRRQVPAVEEQPDHRRIERPARRAHAFNDKGQPLRREELLAELGLRFRDVEIGPDGYRLSLDGSSLRQRPAGRGGDSPRAARVAIVRGVDDVAPIVPFSDDLSRIVGGPDDLRSIEQVIRTDAPWRVVEASRIRTSVWPSPM